MSYDEVYILVNFNFFQYVCRKTWKVRNPEEDKTV